MKYPNAKLLPSGDFFIIFDIGIYIYNFDFSQNNSIYNFTEEEKIKEYKQINLREFRENNNSIIICLNKGNFLYIFESKINTFLNFTLEIFNAAKYYSIIPYKWDNNELQYIIIYNYNISYYYKIKFDFYKINFSLNNNSFINSTEYNNNYKIRGNFLSCEKGLNNSIICFYQNFFLPEQYELVASTFDINLNIINNGTVNISKEINDIASSSNGENKFFVSISYNDDSFSCFIYENEEFKYLEFDTLRTNTIKIMKNYFFPETSQYISIFFYSNTFSDSEFSILIFNDNFTQNENDLYDNITISLKYCSDIKDFDFIYSITCKTYGLINDCDFSNTGINWKVIYNFSLYQINNTNCYTSEEPLNTDFYFQNFSTFPINTILSSNANIISDISTFSSHNSFYSDNFLSSIPSIYFLSSNSSLILPTSSFLEINISLFSSYLYSKSSSLRQSDLIYYKKDINKEEIIKNLSEIINEIEIGKNYEIEGDDFSLVIKPTNSNYIESQTHINFSKCEKILRNEYNISASSILTILQMEINNKKEKSLVNQVEYQVYDDNKTLLNLSLCNDTNIKIIYAIKNNLLDISSISSFKDLDIDVFNINDLFFNDICSPYSDSKDDMVLEDRIKYIFKNYSLCDEGCTYDKFNIEYNTISCNCNVKTNISINETSLNLEKFDDIKIESNFGLIKCYKLVFSWNGKSKNIGFWIFLILVIAHFPLLFSFFYKGIKPIKEYIIEEMEKNGYIKGKKNSRKIKKKYISKKISNLPSSPPKKINLLNLYFFHEFSI